MSPDANGPNAQDRATHSSDNVTLLLDSISIGREEGNNSRPGHEVNESQDPGPAEDNPLGTGEQSAESLQANLSIEDVEMNLAEIEMRFNQATRTRYKPKVQPMYMLCFRTFWNAAALEGYSKRQLAGPKGKQLILDHLQRIPRGSWSNSLAKIKSVWTIGIGLPWPINNKVDIGRLPRSRPEPTPPNGPIKEWTMAVSKEKDPYLRLVWLLIAQHGWRPSHATGVRWSDVQYDEHGHPYAIIASGAGAEFKTYAPVAVRLAPDVIQALEGWSKVHPDPNGNAFILPYRGLTGKLNATRHMETDKYRDHWAALQKRYGLPKLTPKALRHWVSTACRKAGLSKRASAYLQGHEADGGSSMRDWYDNVPIEEIFQEQAERFPNGPLATVLPIEVELIPDLPPEAVALLSQLLSREIGPMKFLGLIEEIQLKMDKPAKMTL